MNKKKRNKPVLIQIATALLLVGVTIYIAICHLHLGQVEYTNNAQVKRLIVPINCRVEGFVKEVCFEEFAEVRKGDTLVVIEDTEYRLQVAQAEVDYRKVNVGKSMAYTSFQAAQNNIHVSDASTEEARVAWENAEVEYKRYETLLEKEAVTRQQYENVKATRDQARARYDKLLHQRQSTTLESKGQQLFVDQSDAIMHLAELRLEQARLNLSYTVITAPCDGVIGRKTLQAGQLLRTGQHIADIVDSEEIWVTAHYKESQIAHIREGQPVKLRIDAFPDTDYRGVVRSISDGTGASFSVIPQDNSTGNFVKVQQRVPVRIEFTDDNPPEFIQRLRAGLNVECIIDYGQK